jgi:uncharacterized protein YdaU (DUF1376 family)
LTKQKRDAWFPFYVGDYLRDTSRLTTELHGAYLLLILDYWTKGPLPDDDAALAAITRLAPAAWKKARAALEPFFQIGDGLWRHKRIDRERDRAMGITALRSMAGKESANRKAAKRATHVATGDPTNDQQTATPSQSQRITSTESVSVREAACVAGAPQPRSHSSEPKKLGASMSEGFRAMMAASLAPKGAA